ncbi:MAG: glutamate---cysteine ligase / carboxylate-amine ligase [Solirubrobacteraceae bacterium]|jgi:carboxylate-amine ligase|nr:glutamate---cysteine ligase / carboxylate-amine ligase [Solirubrobacteraceae bacterium]
MTVEHAFGGASGFTLGVEEELLLVDPETHKLSPTSDRVLRTVSAPEGAITHEAYAAELELRSPPSPGAAEATRALGELRGAARDAGATLMGAGVHPAGAHGEADLVDSDRYGVVADTMRGLIRRTPECALHVHVGMPDPDSAIRSFNGLRAWLPLLAGLSANSPFWFGEDSGLASARAFLVRPYPGRGIPRAFRDYEDYSTVVGEITAAADVADYTYLWWDVRPHPRLGTVEIREMDAQSSLDDVAALAALAHGLAVSELERPTDPLPTKEAISWSAFHAARDGVDATIWHDGARRPLAEVARIAVTRVTEVARAHDGEAALAGVERIIREGGGAGRQRAAFRRGGMPGLLAALVDWT